MHDRPRLVDTLRSRLADSRALLDLREHDLDRVYEAGEQFLRDVLDLLEAGRIAEAKARIRWHLSRVPS